MSEPDRFNLLLQTTMNDLASQLLNVRSGAKKFKTKEATFTPLQKLYTLAQCTPDLSGADCNSCLKIATNTLPGCCGGKQEGIILFPSCIIQYAVSPFYTVNTSVPTPTEALVPGSAITPKGKFSLFFFFIINNDIGFSFFFFLFFLGRGDAFCFCCFGRTDESRAAAFFFFFSSSVVVV